MRVTDGFRDFVLDQLSGVDGLRAKAMFGGVGLYAEDAFFGMMAADVLFFKVDDTTRRDYEAAGSSPFKPYADHTMTMPYYAVPAIVIEDPAVLRQWAARALAVAKAAKPARARTSAKAARPARAKSRAKR